MCFGDSVSSGATTTRHPNNSLAKERFLSSSINYDDLRHMAKATSTSQWIIMGLLVAVASGIFSTYFPYVVDPTFGVVVPQIYRPAWYQYDPTISLFDNTFLTYGTDYGLAVVMTCWALLIGSNGRSVFKSRFGSMETNASFLRTHVWLSRGLMMSYAISVLCGALAHHYFLTVSDRNTFEFRALWTVCVGSVTAASGWMGSIAALWAQRDEQQKCAVFPVVPVPFWFAYAALGTFVVMLGGWSYQRPACDIFIAGITQIPCSMYASAMVYKGLPTLPGFSGSYRYKFATAAWVLNAPLLPLYPFLVSTGLSLGEVNAVLHFFLLMGWSSQGHVLWTVAKALQKEATPPPRAIPLKTKAR